MTYNVFGGTLNLAQSVNLLFVLARFHRFILAYLSVEYRQFD